MRWFAEKVVLDAIAKLLPEEHREDFYRVMAHLHDVERDDVILQIVEATGFLGLACARWARRRKT